MTFWDLSPYCVLLFYRLIRDWGPRNNFSPFCKKLGGTSCESSCRITLSCTTQHWAPHKVTQVLWHVLCWSVYSTFHAILVLFHTSGWLCWKPIVFDLSQLCLSMMCIFRCSGSKPLTFFLLFWRGLLTCCLHSLWALVECFFSTERNILFTCTLSPAHVCVAWKRPIFSNCIMPCTINHICVPFKI